LGKIWDHADIVSRYLWPVMIAAGVTVTVRDGEGKSHGGEIHRPSLAATLLCIVAHQPEERRRAGTATKTVQARMGHASIVVTMDTYGHLFPSSDDGSELAEAEKLLLA